MTDKERLETIKELVKKIESILYDEWQRQELTNLIESLYYADHVDWLIQQVEEKIQLEEYVKKLEEENDKLKQQADFWKTKDGEMMLLSHENQRYREALEFYADEKSWEFGDPYEPLDCDIMRDYGKKAQEALEGEE